MRVSLYVARLGLAALRGLHRGRFPIRALEVPEENLDLWIPYFRHQRITTLCVSYFVMDTEQDFPQRVSPSSKVDPPPASDAQSHLGEAPGEPQRRLVLPKRPHDLCCFDSPPSCFLRLERVSSNAHWCTPQGLWELSMQGRARRAGCLE
jgi:hypothetical protein